MKFTRAALLSMTLLLLDVGYGYSRVHIGFKGGYNMGLHYGNKNSNDPYDVTTHFRHAAGGGILIYMGITESFGIQHELLYIMKGSREDIVLVDAPVETYVEYDMNYLEIPVAFKFTAHRFKGFSLYGMSGFALSILLKSHYELTGTVELDVGGEITSSPISASSDMSDVDIFDFGFLFGGGVDFEIGNQNVFLEYRFTIGWNELMLPTYTGQEPVPLRNQSYSFMLGIRL